VPGQIGRSSLEYSHVYTFNLLVRETRGVDNRGRFSRVWRLPAFDRFRIHLRSNVPVALPRITMNGTDRQDQPVKMVIDLSLPQTRQRRRGKRLCPHHADVSGTWPMNAVAALRRYDALYTVNSTRLSSGSRRYTLVDTPRAHVRGPGPASGTIPLRLSRARTSLTDPAHSRQKSAAPAVGFPAPR
jgi:hypothetical protein